MTEMQINIDDTSNLRSLSTNQTENFTQSNYPVIEPQMSVISPYKVVLPVPMLMETSDPILILRKDAFGTDHPYFSPIQLPGKLWSPSSKIKILKENMYFLPDLMRVNHRLIKGQLNWSIRVTSNTGIGGNLLITQANNVIRDTSSLVPPLGTTGQKYDGYMAHTDLRKGMYTMNGYMLVDLSLAKNAIVIGSGSVDAKWMDNAWLTSEFVKMPKATSQAGLIAARLVYEQFNTFFTETVNLIYLDSDITGAPGSITLSFQVDYSQCEWNSPLYPSVYSTTKVANKILDYTAIFYHNNNPTPMLSSSSTETKV